MTYYAGLDVALRTVAICIVDASDKVHLERSCVCDVDQIAKAFNTVPGVGQVVALSFKAAVDRPGAPIPIPMAQNG
jgi:hypothetical protein